MTFYMVHIYICEILFTNGILNKTSDTKYVEIKIAIYPSICIQELWNIVKSTYILTKNICSAYIKNITLEKLAIILSTLTKQILEEEMKIAEHQRTINTEL